jgi:hypothetical protein
MFGMFFVQQFKMKQMKTLKLTVVFFLLFFSLSLSSFAQKEEIVAAMKTGNVDKMSKHFDQMIDLNVPGRNNTYSKGQGELVLKDFFAANRVKNFEVQHSGSNPSSNFIIGTLFTSNGDYRTTVYMRQRGDKLLIQGIEFEPKN